MQERRIIGSPARSFVSLPAVSEDIAQLSVHASAKEIREHTGKRADDRDVRPRLSPLENSYLPLSLSLLS